MDLIKIGKFIATCRKSKKLTQEQLAEKLCITDRAVSKWERGISLPDAGIMLELCNILDINVNELLNGEKINMKDYKEKNENLLLELAKQEELKNKKTYGFYVDDINNQHNILYWSFDFICKYVGRRNIARYNNLHFNNDICNCWIYCIKI